MECGDDCWREFCCFLMSTMLTLHDALLREALGLNFLFELNVKVFKPAM